MPKAKEPKKKTSKKATKKKTGKAKVKDLVKLPEKVEVKQFRRFEGDLTEEQINFLNVLAAKANNITLTCQATQIGRATIYHWRNNNPDFANGLEEVKKGLIDWGRTKRIQFIEAGHYGALRDFLKVHDPEGENPDKIDLNVSGDININFNVRADIDV